MKVHVDELRCEGQAVCTGLAPAVFELGDDDEFVRVQVDEIPAELEARVRKAVAKCPMAALSIEE
ncbi:ferredoxin [Dietzia sp.]|uniref:ferredoxin n=1 Tax=Dietzia sp. TaxID=1871616 RepID=UPI002FD95B14